MDTIRVYHGTSAAHQASITQGGLRDAYVTDSADLAWYYAEESAEETGTDPVVFAFEALAGRLAPDHQAWAEPVSAGVGRLADMEDAVARHDGPVTATDTLRVVRSATCPGVLRGGVRVD